MDKDDIMWPIIACALLYTIAIKPAEEQIQKLEQDNQKLQQRIEKLEQAEKANVSDDKQALYNRYQIARARFGRTA